MCPRFEAKEGYQDVCVETEINMASDPFPTGGQREEEEEEEDEEELEESSKMLVKGEFTKSQAKSGQKSACETTRKLWGRTQLSCVDRVAGIEKRERAGSWWKDSGQTILQFFSKILGKRAGMAAKGPSDRVLPIGKRVKRVSRDSRSHNTRHRRSADGSIHLRRVSNGYMASRANRYENARDSTVAENKSWKEEQQQQLDDHEHPSILVRQIQQTRDKNLRVMLLERELRVRLPSIAKKDVRPIANDIVNVRQLSSPLC